jgi:hypothetical protein
MQTALSTEQGILQDASNFIASFRGYSLDVLSMGRPRDIDEAIHLAKTVSKLSPVIGNSIEYRCCGALNQRGGWPFGRWLRQDPGFPDIVFVGDLPSRPGIEIKAWYSLASEITGRFKESVSSLEYNPTNVAVIAWVLDGVIYGRPVIVDVWLESATTLAAARDNHYHNPPGYLVLEPEDTRHRAGNLQQTNTTGYKFQGTSAQLEEAKRIVATWGAAGVNYDSTPEYQAKIKELLKRFDYRAESNYARIDRLYPQLEALKASVDNYVVAGRTISEWKRIIKAVTDDSTELDTTAIDALQELVMPSSAELIAPQTAIAR